MIERLKMEKRAIAFRERYNIGPTEAVKYYDLLERLGIITLFAELSDGVSGMAIKVDDYRFMLINRNMVMGKQHFTIGHELYHLYEQEDFSFKVSSVENFSRQDKEEYLADLFASHLLLPGAGILALVPDGELAKNKIDITTILKIEQYFLCSRIAVLYRLKELGLISDDYSEQFKTGIAKSALDHDYPRDLYFATTEDKFFGTDYISTIETLYEKGIMKEIDYITSMQDIGIAKI
ncbi:MAG: hypothetical protein JWP12_1616 [Bacteroidetes bacterium]|nr:hypothetical protein [Bacteroidota bacterium]